MSTVLNPDRVMLGPKGAEKPLSAAAFLMIPVEQQLELLFRGEVTFFSGQTPVRALDALKVLRAQRAPGAAVQQ